MSLLENSIGDHHFLILSGNIIPPTKSVEINQRPDVNGVEICLTGVKGKTEKENTSS